MVSPIIGLKIIIDRKFNFSGLDRVSYEMVRYLGQVRVVVSSSLIYKDHQVVPKRGQIQFKGFCLRVERPMV